ncbi:NAD(P)H-binding protein [Bdellovibrio bacteriovorus]|uniref:NAD(P)H-binding protein n=1 Tax=Bdellovibrio bacteriovorus TaxID=959 RepID=UPI0021CF008C|nr:NAD(P)H-binding protein [Bdellovibrio bacteriovorus]UXR64075.1 NAD(P)H-binding protein [Bdellovibrio bacteriovorus]
MKVAIAGASGFVGKALIKELQGQHDVVALSRSVKPESASGIEWRSCDLFSLLDAEKALEGCDVAVYLVHSMRPSAQLTQGSFEDFDLIVADNFIRAAEKCGVKRILYLGGMYSENASTLSRHLKSRHEVEGLFIASKIPATILRAAMILGPEGSSFHMMVRLVQRLPVMVCPQWSRTISQPIALKDVVKSLHHCIETAQTANHIYDLGGPDIVSYLDMMKMTAHILGRKRIFLPVPLLSPELSTLWVCLVTKAPRALVRPLIEGLKVPLIVRPGHELAVPGYKFTPLKEALQIALNHYQKHQAPLAFQKNPIGSYEVRSVQRLLIPEGVTAAQVARAYMDFLPTMRPGFMKVEVSGRWVSFSWSFPYLRLLILEYSPERSWSHRQLFYVRGGLLAQKTVRGRLEFREILGGKAVIAAIHEFKPRMPWFLYRWTQALFHVWVMYKFGLYLKRPHGAR